jgi:hypothetical protein
MPKKSSNLIRLFFLLWISILLPLGVTAQSKSSPADKKSKAAKESCDGALDIVPSKPMTFARKRRPSSNGTKQSPPPDANDAKGSGNDAKSEKQRSGGDR